MKRKALEIVEKSKEIRGLLFLCKADTNVAHLDSLATFFKLILKILDNY